MIVAFQLLLHLYMGLLSLRLLLALSYAKRLPPARKPQKLGPLKRLGRKVWCFLQKRLTPTETNTFTDSQPDSSFLPPGTLTIAQAILSGDPLLESRLSENLNELKGQSFCWLIDEKDAEARRIAEELQRPDLIVRLCPPCPDATNPKLWKLAIAAQQVQTPFFAVIDDDTTISEASAAVLVDAASTHTVATGLPCYLSRGFASGLLAQFVNNNSVFTYLGTSRLLPPFTLNGMGYVMRTEALERVGFFKPILHELTDDLALATLVLKQGGTIHQSAAPLRVQTGVRNLKHYWQMMHRWYVFTMLLLQRQRIMPQALIFALHGLPPLLLAAAVFLGLLSGQIGMVTLGMLTLLALAQLIPRLTRPLIVLLLLVFTPLYLVAMVGAGNTIFSNSSHAANLWATTTDDWLFAGLLQGRSMALLWTQRRYFGQTLLQPFTSVLSELIQPLHLIHSLCSRTIRWRTRLYKVRDTHDFREVGS